MNLRPIVYTLLSGLFLLTSCQTKVETPSVDSAQLIKQVKDQVEAFHATDTSLNAQGMVDLLWPEFTMLADGHYVTYQDVKTGSKAFMASLEIFHTVWSDLKITPLGNQHAISSFIFTDSLVAKDGKITQSRGPNTFVWEKRQGKWKVIYGDADHYPIQ